MEVTFQSLENSEIIEECFIGIFHFLIAPFVSEYRFSDLEVARRICWQVACLVSLSVCLVCKTSVVWTFPNIMRFAFLLNSFVFAFVETYAIRFFRKSSILQLAPNPAFCISAKVMRFAFGENDACRILPNILCHRHCANPAFCILPECKLTLGWIWRTLNLHLASSKTQGTVRAFFCDANLKARDKSFYASLA